MRILRTHNFTYIVLAAAMLAFVGCREEGLINKTKYQGERVKNYCQDFEEEINSLVEANQGMEMLRVSEYDNSQFDYFYLEPGQMEQKGDTLYFRLINDINYDKYLDKGVAVQVRVKYRTMDHLKDIAETQQGKISEPLIVNKEYYQNNKDPFFVYKVPVEDSVNGKQISLFFSILQYKNGDIKRKFCGSVENPLGPLDPPCCTFKPWRDTDSRSVVQTPELDIKPEDYHYEGFTGTLDLIFPMNSVDYNKDEVNNVIQNYIDKYKKEGFQVESISLNGYASQGGTTEYNQKLSSNRSKAVYDHLKKHFEQTGKMKDIQVSHQGMGEDWDRFELLVKTAVFSDQERQKLLDIANSAKSKDEREAELRKLPFWEKLIKEVLVYCRHVYVEFDFKYQPDDMYVKEYPSAMPVISPELYNVATKNLTITKYDGGGNPQEGLSTLNTLIDVNNNRRANLYAMRSTYHFALDNVKNAISDIERAMNKDQDNTQFGIAALSYKTKFADQYTLEERMNMLSEYNSFTLENQDNKILQYNRVVMMDKVGFISGALAEYESMMSGDTESALLFNNRGVARMKTNRLVEAEADFNEAIKKDPKLAEPYFNLAIINAYKGFPNKTIDNLKKAIKMDSSLEKGIEANPAFDVVRTNPKFKKAFN